MNLDIKKLLNAGVHFGHLTRKRHPNMVPYIFMEKDGTHIIDLNQTVTKLEESLTALKKSPKPEDEFYLLLQKNKQRIF